MHASPYFKNKIFRVQDAGDFDRLALELFYYQASHNPVYRQYIKHLGRHPTEITHLEEVPFLPLSAFRQHRVITGGGQLQKCFRSSGTTGSAPSRHFVTDMALYRESFTRAFRHFYGPPEQYCLLGLLPSYIEREDASLVYMVQELMRQTNDAASGFYLRDHQRLLRVMHQRLAEGGKVLLLGVTFALLDLAENAEPVGENLIVIETGGMKGRREEMTREAVHQRLKAAFGVSQIHSEYGMTEMLSQAYSRGGGRFETPPWLRVQTRDPRDPFAAVRPGKTGGLNLIDLANVHSCAFLETQDLGRLHEDASFEVLGRFDNADIRGCNLMVL